MKGLPPLITDISRPYWNGLREHKIVLQNCSRCHRTIFYPRLVCNYCGGRDLEWRPATGEFILYTFSTAEVPVSDAFSHLEKPVLAVVEIEGVRVPTTLIGVEQEMIEIGMALAPVFDPETYPGITLLRFGPAQLCRGRVPEPGVGRG